jgi:hypothetical protein
MAKPKLGALITAFTDQVQALETALYDMILGRSVGWATGATLDKVGGMVGRPRPAYGLAATDDRAYRALIYAQIIANTSHGTPETVYSLMRLLGATAISLAEPGDYVLMMQFSGDMLLDGADIRSVVERATPPVELIATEYVSGPFGFADDPDTLGFGDGQLARSI